MRPTLLLVFVAALLFVGACKPSRRVSVPPLLTPVTEADTRRLMSEINRLGSVQSVRGKIDIQFLDTSFAACGVAEKYSTADGTVTLQRPGQIYLQIQIPFIGTDVAQMTSDGERFRVAVLQGDEKYKRFVVGTNNAVYPKLEEDGVDVDCGNGDRRNQKNMQRTVSSLSGLRPQHFTDALLIRPLAQAGSNLIYSQTETFEEEPDMRPNARRNARVVRPYYLLLEIEPLGEGRARVLRRFWFDRVSGIRLARLQTYDERGQLTTDVVYSNPQPFGEDARYILPSQIEITRPQDRYSIRIAYQSPPSVRIDRPYPADVFVLQNKWQLPEVNLDERNRSALDKR